MLIDSDNWLIGVASFDGITPLHVAAKHDQQCIVDYLLSKGASLSALTSSGAPPLFFAASNGGGKTAKEILTHEVNYLAKDEDGVNVLHCAVGHTKTLRAIIESLEHCPEFNELLSAPDNSGSTPLHYACQYGNLADVALLVDHGAQLDLVMEDGVSPLHLAAGRGHLAIVKRLSWYSPRLINAADDYGRTPLHIASLYGYPKVVEDLLLNGATLVADRDGRTPFFSASWKGSTECLKLLLSTFHCGLDHKDSEKATVLHLATLSNHPEVVSFLLDHGASITLDEAGRNCLDIAIASDFEQCASAILNHDRWKESMKPLSSPLEITQLQSLVQKMPDQAVVIMDKCIDSTTENGKVKVIVITKNGILLNGFRMHAANV
jgi:ankyrin repeat protein